MAFSRRDSDELHLALAQTQDGSDPSYRAAISATVEVKVARQPDARSAAGAEDKDPRTIGRHTVLRRLGQGGMGVVYAAYDQELDRKIAVKLLHTGPGDTIGRQRLVREAQALARLSHPNVVTIYEVAEAEGRVYIAMEFVEGQNLSTWQAEAHPWEEVLAMYLQAGRGLHAAHEAGLVHRNPFSIISVDKSSSFSFAE